MIAKTSAIMAIVKKQMMKLLSNQSSVWPRSRTTSRHAKAIATEKMPQPSIFSFAALARGFDFAREFGRIGEQLAREDQRNDADREC